MKFSDLFTEKKGGKMSSKKFWGNIFLTFCSVTYILDGFNFYAVNTHLFNPILIAGCTLIGMHTAGNTVGNMFKGNTDANAKPSQNVSVSSQILNENQEMSSQEISDEDIPNDAHNC